MPRKKFTMDDFYAQMDEIRERHRPKSAVAPTGALDKIRLAIQQRRGLPQLPKLPKI